MGVTYYKRFRMEADLRRDWRRPALPAGYRYARWSADRLLEHAEAKFHAFHAEIDAGVFPCLADEDGCLRLMEEIASKPGFLPEATWLVEYVDAPGPPEPIGTIQGVRITPRYGSIQNVGVTPWGRGRGIGRALVMAALEGFGEVGLQRATLEVTATNTPAVAMYESLGFRRVRTSYRAVEFDYA
ncbi:putative acetyltransferase [Botrimarina colliarenosi]|uniref:Putative acetyltransferase n=1 Tax=Botrimarina colliarenosi TaxID=2528001 RepID=A0A5C6AAK5_9BACT|nr:GNAT family N-acetyltransferase [Botrimarina colliarenosi]TWT96081.1 putative acetyltransferase [Botrimarina colliarenosi]